MYHWEAGSNTYADLDYQPPQALIDILESMQNRSSTPSNFCTHLSKAQQPLPEAPSKTSVVLAPKALSRPRFPTIACSAVLYYDA